MARGCITLVILTLLEGLSGFGRTSALSPLLSDLCHDLSLSLTQISSAYMLANLSAGLVLPYIGRFYDRSKASHFLYCFVALFGCAFISMSLLKYFSLPPFANLLIIWSGYSLVRISVHSYSVAGRSAVATWFTQQRGLIISVSSLIIMLIASAIPSICFSLHQHFTWSTFWQIIGSLWLLLIPICTWVKKSKTSSPPPSIKTRQNIKQKPYISSVLYTFMMLLFFFRAFQNTGISFHLVPLCQDLLISPKIVSRCFIPITILSITIMFLFGHFFYKLGPKVVLLIFLLADIGMLCTMGAIKINGMLYGFIGCTGFYWGLSNIVVSMILPLIFGTKHIGALNGWHYSCVSIGGAVGPFYFGIMKDFTSYQTALSICTAFSIFLLVLFSFLHKQIKPWS